VSIDVPEYSSALRQIFPALLAAATAIHSGGAAADVAPVPYWNYHGKLDWGPVTPTERVIRDQTEFRKFWENLQTTPANEGRGVPEAPDVDFRTEMIIAVGMGRRSTGGYSIRIESVQEELEDVRVFYSAVSPGADCVTSQSITSPVVLIRLRKSAKLVRFGARHVIRDCKS
jgi:hypothetical protein